jgi:hypothetical protein
MAHVVNVSSNANNAANAGTFYVNSNNDSGNRNRNIGTHLAVSCSLNLTPSLLGEYVYPIQFGREAEELGEHQR